MVWMWLVKHPIEACPIGYNMISICALSEEEYASA